MVDWNDDIDLDDMFEATTKTVALDGEDAAIPMRPYRVTQVETSAVCQALALPPDGLRLRYTRDDYHTEVHYEALLANRLKRPVILRELHGIARDATGTPVDVDSNYDQAHVERNYELLGRFRFSTDTLAEMRSIELLAEYKIHFDHLLAAGHVEGLDLRRTGRHRERFELRLELQQAEAGMPRFDLALTCHVGYRHEPFISFLGQLVERTASMDRWRELTYVLRDGDGAAIARESQSFTIPAAGLDTLRRTDIGVTRSQIRRVRRVEVMISGDCERVEALGIYPVTRGD